MAAFLKNFLLLIINYGVSLLTFLAGTAVYQLVKGTPSGLRDAGYLGCTVVYENESLAHILSLVIPLLLFAGQIVFLATKLNTAVWFKFILTFLFTLTFLGYFYMAEWILTDFEPTEEMFEKFGPC